MDIDGDSNNDDYHEYIAAVSARKKRYNLRL